MVEASILLLVTLAAALVSLYARQWIGLPPFPVGELRFEFDPMALGFGIRSLILPLLLVYALSGAPFFRRIIGDEVKPRDRLRLAGTLVMIELIALVEDLNFSAPDRSVFGAFVIIIGGLLGGWRLGLGLGLVGMLFSGSVVYFIELNGGTLIDSLRGGVPPGVPAVPFWLDTLVAVGRDFILFYVLNLRALMSVWLGITAGLVGGWLGDRWLVPAIAFTFGMVIELATAILMLPTALMPVGFIVVQIASAILTGLGLGVVALVVRSQQASISRRKAAEAELAVAHAELRALRAQIKPHFLFNALNTIRYFVRTDPETARQLLLNLSEVFQRAIRSGEFVRLRDELSCVQAYLALEQARLGERLKVTWSGAVTEPQQLQDIESPLLDQAVPTLSVQPIVENAVIHGISKKPEGGTVCIAIDRVGMDLVIAVEDNGVGIEPARQMTILQPAAEGDTSIAVRNVDGRLRALYGADDGLVIESVVGQGTRVRIRIPIEKE